jgi:glycosyltransferase involved in cell wall biosynthesis
LRILHVAYIYPPELKVADGITNVVFNVTKELARRGHQVSVYTSDMLDLHGNNSLRANHLVINGVDVYYSRSVWRSKTFIVTPSMISLLSKNIGNFDIIHIHDARSFQGISTYLFAKAKNVPYVFQPHGSYLSSMPISDLPTKRIAKIVLDKFVSGKIVQNASKIIALSQAETREYVDVGISQEKIAIIPNGTDLSEYADLPSKGVFRKKFGIDDEKLVLYLGRIHRIKGVDILVRAFANIVEKLDDAKLVVAGPDDGYLGELKALIRALKIENKVLISGPLYGKDKLEAYIDADVYVLPSRYETFPMSVLESMACGTPIILTENCGIAEYFRDKTGLVVKTDSPSHLQEALLEMLMNREKQKVFRENCKTVMQKFNISKTVPKLEKIYEDVVKRSEWNINERKK